MLQNFIFAFRGYGNFGFFVIHICLTVAVCTLNKVVDLAIYGRYYILKD